MASKLRASADGRTHLQTAILCRYATNSELLQVLRFLGLRMAVDLGALASVAKRVAELPECEDKSERAIALLSYIDDNANSLFNLTKKKRGMFSRMLHSITAKTEGSEDQTASFFADIAFLPWIPVLRQKPHKHMPWPNVDETPSTTSMLREPRVQPEKLDTAQLPMPGAQQGEPTEDTKLQAAKEKRKAEAVQRRKRIEADRLAAVGTEAGKAGGATLTGPSTTAIPADCRLPSDIWLTSATMRIVAIPIRSDFVREQLGFLKKIPARVAATQILAWQKVSMLAASDSEGIDSHLSTLISRHMPELYAVLNAACVDDALFFKGHVVRQLQGQHWVWTGSGDFVEEQHVALRSRLDCRPYLHTLDSSIAQAHPALFQAMGIKQTFVAEDFMHVLRQLHSKYAEDSIKGDNHGTDGDDGNVEVEPSRPLASGDLKLSLAALHQLVDCADPDAARTSGVCVPDIRGCLCPGPMLVYNDSVWAPPTQHRLVHQNISNAVAAAVGIQSVIEHVLSPSMSDDLEAYGQEESLTSRLAGLLEVYPDGPSIFKELVQNADDAGASVVHIVLDVRQWGTTSLLGESMGPWNGPAICVYNDATFKQKDFASLASLANSSKFGDVGSTGRFGCGWNSVYHFTDVPSIVSGEHVVFLDPHRKYLPGTAGFSRPGMKIRFVGTRIKQQFPDQFDPFCNYFGCDMENQFNGTLFRFPLRTAELAADSEIKSGQPYMLDDIRSLFAAFHLHLTDLLLFLKNVKSVVVSEIDANGTMHEQFATQVTRLEDVDPSCPRQQFDAFFRQVDGGRTLSHTALVKRLATFELQKRSAPSSMQLKDIQVRRAEPPESRSVSWLVSAVVGGPLAINLACEEDLSRLKLVPVGGVAARVTGLASVGRAFVFLPLPVETNLPVHVNGCFEISSNRRDLWSGGDMTGDGQRRSKWNEALLEDGIGLAWSQLVMASKGIKEIGGSLEEYYKLFPRSLGVAKPWTYPIKGFYTYCFTAPVLRLAPRAHPTVEGTSSDANASSDTRRWVCPCDALFVPSDAAEKKIVANGRPQEEPSDRYQNLAAALHKFGLNIPSCPQVVVDEFLRYIPDSDMRLATPEFLRLLLKKEELDVGGTAAHESPSFDYVGTADEVQTQTVMQYLMEGLDGEYSDLLGIPCCPLNDGKWATLSAKGGAPALYICNTEQELKLLDFAVSRLVHPSVTSANLVQHYHHPNFLKVSQLEVLDHTAVSELIRKHLSGGWSSQRPQPEQQWQQSQVGSHNAVVWLNYLWDYLSANLRNIDTNHAHRQMTAADVMVSFVNITMIPGSDGALYPVQPHTAASHAVTCKSGLPLDVAAILVMLGCVLSNDNERFKIPEKFMRAVTNSSDQHGVLLALSHNACIHVDSSVPGPQRLEALSQWFSRCKLEPVHRRALFNFFSACSGYSEDELQGLATLPIYELHPTQLATAPSSASTAGPAQVFTSIATCQQDGGMWIPPQGIPRELLSSSPFAKVSSTQHSTFLNSLGIKEMTMPAYLSNTGFSLFPTLNEEVRDTWVADILRNLRVFEQSSSGWAEELRGTAFVPNKEGALCKPTELYHPRVEEVSDFLGHGSCYPAEQFCSPDILEVLASLGLRDKAGAEALLQGIHSIAGAADGSIVNIGEDDATLYARAVHLVTFFDKHAEELSQQKVLQESVDTLRTKRWIPVLRQPPHAMMPWPTTSNSFTKALYSPKQSRPADQAWLASSEYHIASTDVTSPAALEILGWSVPHDPTALAVQLVALSEATKLARVEPSAHVGAGADHDRSHNGPDGDNGHTSSNSANNEFWSHATAAVFQIYSLLSEPTVVLQDPGTVAQILQGSSWLWMGQESHISSEKFAFNHMDGFNGHARPWLFTFADMVNGWERLDEEYAVSLQSVTPFLTWVGSRDVFAGSDYIEVLQKLAAACSSAESTLSLNAHPPNEVEFAVGVARACAESHATSGPNAIRQLLVPTADGKIVPCHAVTYNDAAWMDTDSAAGFDFVHPDISNELASVLGIKSLQSLLNANIDFCGSLHCPTIENLGPALTKLSKLPKEDLVLDVLYDLLEVVDRLGCQSASILIDERKLAKQSVFQPTLRDVHENALVIFVPGITIEPEELSTLIDPYKFRSFRHPQHLHSVGLGLASAFRISDIVTVLSGECLTFFDPTGTFVKTDLTSSSNTQATAPDDSTAVGKSYSFGRSRLMHQFPDQFNVFELYGFDGTSAQAFPNTIFRFPLRGDGRHIESKIAQRFPYLAVSTTDVRSGVAAMQASRTQPLLFATRLNRLSIESLHTRDAAAADTAEADSSNDNNNNSIVNNNGSTPSARSAQHVQTLLSKISIRPGQDLSSRTLLAETHSWKSKFSLRGAVHKKVAATYTLVFDIIETGDTALPFSEEWAVSLSLACPAAQDLSYTDELRFHCLKPMVGVAYNLSQKENEQPSTAAITPTNTAHTNAQAAGKLLCGSPCVGDYGFEMHIYGYFAKQLDGGLLKDSQNQSPRLVSWNQLLADSLAEPMACVLEKLSLTRNVERNPMFQYKAWPKPTAVNKLFAPMCTSLYRKLAGMQVFFKANGRRCAMSEGHFLTQSANPMVREYLCEKFQSMIEIDSECLDQLVEADSKRSMFARKAVHKLTPDRLRAHVRSDIRSFSDLKVQRHQQTAGGADARAMQEDQVKLASQLFQFCSSDLRKASPAVQKDTLRGLCLLPLSNNEVVEIGSVQAIMATETEQKLLPKDSMRYVHPVMTRIIRSSPEDKALLNTVGVRDFTPSFVAYHMHKVVPPRWKGQPTIGAAEAQKMRGTDWFKALWSYITTPEDTQEYHANSSNSNSSSSGNGENRDAAANSSTLTPGVGGVSSASDSAATTPVRSASTLTAAGKRCDDVCLDWPLLPTHGGGLTSAKFRKRLLPPASMCHADAEIVAAINLLGCPCLDEAFTECVAVLGGAPPENDPEFDLWPTYFLQKLGETQSLATSLPDDAAAALCNYFVAKESSLEANPKTKETMRRLPIFETAGGARVTMTSDACTFDPNICAAFQPPASEKYLKHTPDVLPLYSFVDVPVLSEAQVLQKCVENFGQFGEAEKDAMLDSLILRWDSLGDAADNIKAVLADTACVVNRDGVRVLPRTCVDAHNDLLRSVFHRHPAVLPSEECYARSNSRCWEVLHQLGVRHKLDADLFLLCCQHVSEGPVDADAASTAELLQASRELLRFLSTNLSTFQSQDFYVQLKEMRMIALHFNGRLQLATFGEVCMERDQELVGLIKPTLPQDVCPPQVFWNKLGIVSPPSAEMVVANIEAVADINLDEWPMTKPVDAVFERIYEFLSDRWDRISLQLKSKLRCIPLVPVHHQVVPTSRVFARLADQLSPWIFELPRQFVAYDQFLADLGMKAALTMDAIVDVVEGVAEDSRGTTLNPTELRSFIRLLEHLKGMLAAEPLARGLSRLFVPDTLSVLVPIKQCVFMDITFSSQHIAAAPFLVSSPLLTADTCLAIGMKPMSAMVLEELAVRTQAHSETSSFPPALIQALKSMVSVMPHESEFSEQAQLQKIGQLMRYKICAIPTLDVVCRVRRTKKQLGPVLQRCFFVERNVQLIWIASNHMDGVSYEDALTGAVNQIVSPRAPLALAPLLRCAGSHSQMVMDGLAYPTASSVHAHRGTPGEPLLNIDVQLLQMNPARRYYDKEIVAYKDKGAYVYGRLIKKPAEHASKDAASAGSFGALQAHTIEIGSGKSKRLLPSEVWSFKTDTGAAHPTNRQSATADYSDGDGGVGATGQSDDGRGHQASALGTSARSAQLTPAEYLKAAQDLLALANLPLHDQDKQVFGTNLTLQSDLSSTRRELAAAKAQLEATNKKLNKLENSSQCAICLQGPADGVPVNIALKPCGHLFCGSCAPRLHECATCKSQITGRLTVYS